MTNTREFPRIAPGTPLPEAVRQLAAAEIRTVHVALVDLFGNLRKAARTLGVDIGTNVRKTR